LWRWGRASGGEALNGGNKGGRGWGVVAGTVSGAHVREEGRKTYDDYIPARWLTMRLTTGAGVGEAGRWLIRQEGKRREAQVGNEGHNEGDGGGAGRAEMNC